MKFLVYQVLPMLSEEVASLLVAFQPDAIAIDQDTTQEASDAS